MVSPKSTNTVGNIAKKHRSSMLAMGDQFIDEINTQDLLIDTDNVLLDKAAIGDSQMWMEDWEEDELVVEDRQLPPHQSQDLFSQDMVIENQENFPNRESISNCTLPTNDTPLTSTPSLLNGVMFTGRPNIDESIIELVPSQPPNVRRVLHEKSVPEERPTLPLKRKLFEHPKGMSNLVMASQNDDISVTPLLTQNQQKSKHHQLQPKSENIKSCFIAKHLQISEQYYASDECFALLNESPAQKVKGISYVKPQINAGKKTFDIVLSYNTLCNKPDALYINTYKKDNDGKSGETVYFAGHQLNEVRVKFDHFFKETAGGRAVNTYNWVYGDLKYSLMKEHHGAIVITSNYINRDEGATFSTRIYESDIPLFKKRLNTIWGVVDILDTKKKMRSLIIEKINKKYQLASNESCSLKRFNFVFETYYNLLPSITTSSVIPPIFMCLEGIIRKESVGNFL